MNEPGQLHAQRGPLVADAGNRSLVEQNGGVQIAASRGLFARNDSTLGHLSSSSADALDTDGGMLAALRGLRERTSGRRQVTVLLGIGTRSQPQILRGCTQREPGRLCRDERPNSSARR